MGCWLVGLVMVVVSLLFFFILRFIFDLMDLRFRFISSILQDRFISLKQCSFFASFIIY